MRARRGARPRRPLHDERGRGRRRRRLRHPLRAGRRLRRDRGRDRAGAEAGRDRLRRRLGQRLGHRARWRRTCRQACTSCPAHPVAGTEYSGPDAGFAELFHNRWCILTPPPGTDPAAVERLGDFWAALGANVEIDGAGAPRHGARHHQPRAASDRLQHRRHRRASRGGHAVGGDEVRRRRLPRLHPHRRLRSDDVARRVPQQQARRCWKCSAASPRI